MAELYVLCETRKEAEGRLKSLAETFGFPNPEHVRGVANLSILPDIRVSIRDSQADGASKPVQMHIVCSNAGQLARAKDAVERRKTKRMTWSFAR